LQPSSKTNGIWLGLTKQSSAPTGISMSVYADYQYASNTAAAPRTKAGLLPLLSTNAPAKTPAPATPAAPPFHDLVEIPISPAVFLWEAATMGYGEAADYGLFWLVNGITTDAPQKDELKRLASARITAISRAYSFEPATAGTPFHLRPRGIYPLIEQSEKTNTSYYLGCAMAAVCAPHVLLGRTVPATLGYLFHARLLASVYTATNVTTIQMASAKQVDFLAFDTALNAHIFEAKGSGEGFPYDKVADGIDQCSAVVSVTLDGLAPQAAASLNVMAAFAAKSPVRCGTKALNHSIRVAAFEVLSNPPTVVQTPPHKIPTLSALVGLQAIGVYLSLCVYPDQLEVGRWRRFNTGEASGFEVPVAVAIPQRVHARIESWFYGGYARVKNGPLNRRLQQKFNGEAVTGEPSQGDIDITDMLQGLGSEILFFEADDREDLLPGFARSASVSWLTVGVVNWEGG
jgi:hypothetical protein